MDTEVGVVGEMRDMMRGGFRVMGLVVDAETGPLLVLGSEVRETPNIGL